MERQLITGTALTFDINKKIKPFPRQTTLTRRFYAAAGFYFANGRSGQAKQDAMEAYELAHEEMINGLEGE